MIENTAIPNLIAAMAAAWCLGFCCFALLRKVNKFRAISHNILLQMLSQGFVLACICVFVTAPPALQWMLFLIAGTRIVYEAVVLHLAKWSFYRLAAVLISPFLPLAFFSQHVGQKEVSATLLFAFFLSEVFDSFSLVGGQLFGRHKIAPWLSPQKTLEGTAFGGSIAMFVAIACGWSGLISLNQAFWVGLTAIFFAIVGDLAASFGKRLAQVKDYPILIKGQGGLLDIVDSWLIVSTAIIVLLKTTR